MTFVKKLKLSALNGSFMDRNSVYKLIRDEQYNQYKALNIGMTYLYTHSILKSVGSGEETKLFNKMKKLEIKLLALKEKLKNQEKNSASYIKTLDLVKEHESAIERINLEIDECKNNRIMVDKDFKSMYIDDLYSVLQSQVNFVNKDNMSLVTTKLKKDFASALKLGLANGDCNVINYKRKFLLWFVAET
ncbi:hypothetical protein [Clostridium sp.]|uniref:hypothetical protein n=1 Tax=Clostridium sp. TaxID=1506 RepID=UPI001B7C263F|nr:hypothetical protein [Clostridium sp.]MBP3917373.1 hypothetical protein [Clostridium sp.]